MVEKTYSINRNSLSREIINNWIVKTNGFVSTVLNSGKGEYIFVINHATTNDEQNFESELSKRLGININGTQINLAKYIDEIKTDQLFYTTETAVTKANVGTTYTDIFTDFGGRPFFIDTTGFTKLAVQILWTKVGTGVQTIRIVNDADDTQQIIESGSLITGSNDFANVAIPQDALNFKGKWRLQCKSTVTSDDPSFAGFRLYLRR
jgi:hypothetical protein